MSLDSSNSPSCRNRWNAEFSKMQKSLGRTYFRRCKCRSPCATSPAKCRNRSSGRNRSERQKSLDWQKSLGGRFARDKLGGVVLFAGLPRIFGKLCAPSVLLLVGAALRSAPRLALVALRAPVLSRWCLLSLPTVVRYGTCPPLSL